MKKLFTAIKKIDIELATCLKFSRLSVTINKNFQFIPIGINIFQDTIVVQSSWTFLSFNFIRSKQQKYELHGYFFNRNSNYFKILFDKNTFLLKKV